MLRRITLTLATPVIAVVVSLGLSALILLSIGADPIDTYRTMIEYLSRLESFVDTLNRATPLFISDVAVAIGFKMNLFNIGVEGQYLLASIVAAYVGAQLNLWGPLHVFVIILVAMTVGGLYGAIPGILKVTRNVNEVIATIMLNTIAVSGIISLLLTRWKVEDETLSTATADIPESGRVPNLNSWSEVFTREIIKGRELQGFILIAIVVGIAYHVLVNRTVLGYDLRATGSNPFAASVSGVPPGRTVVLAMALSGAVAGLVGLPQLLGDSYKYNENIIKGLGFQGIAVALIGRNKPLGIAAGALLFGALDTAGTGLEFGSDAPREIVRIMQGIIIFVVVVGNEIARRRRAADEAREAAAAMSSQSTEGVAA